MEFPPNFFQQSCMLFSSVLSKVTIPVSSFNIQIYVHLEKSLRSSADSELLPCRSCSSLNARFWQELLFLTHRCTPQGRSWEWIQNKTVSVKYLSFRMRGHTVRRSPDWCYSLTWETREISVKEHCSELHCHTIFCMWTQNSAAQSRQTKTRSCKPYLYKKVLHDWVMGSNCCMSTCCF